MKRILLLLVGVGGLWLAWDASPGAHPRHGAEWLPAGDLRLRVVRAGQGDTTLLLLHGYGESLMAYRAVFDRLARHHRVVALDLPGFGLSDKAAGPYDLATLEHTLEDFISRWIQGPIVVVGHSMGGELAVALALARPDRIAGLVLIAPAGNGLNPLLGDSGIASLGAGWVAGALTFVLPVHDPNWLEEPADRADYEPGRDSAYRRVARQVLAEFDFSAVGERFRDLKQPALVIWGREDPTIPLAVGVRLAAMIPCHRLVVLPGTLHRPHQTEPDTVVAETETFLREMSCPR
ncbi:MAG: alpha/beta fold hydrolase [Gemmatimonadales bacterium]